MLEKLKQQYEQVSQFCFALQMQPGENAQRVQLLLNHVTWTLKVRGIQQSGDMLTVDEIEALLSEFDALQSSNTKYGAHVSVSEEYATHISHAKGGDGL